jgi:hypothetical protein
MEGVCQRVKKLPCDPGMRGCVLYGRVVFSDPKKNRHTQHGTPNKPAAEVGSNIQEINPPLHRRTQSPSGPIHSGIPASDTDLLPGNS